VLDKVLKMQDIVISMRQVRASLCTSEAASVLLLAVYKVSLMLGSYEQLRAYLCACLLACLLVCCFTHVKYQISLSLASNRCKLSPKSQQNTNSNSLIS
jgi:hypothetical protein